jgi:hypothetical protein
LSGIRKKIADRETDCREYVPGFAAGEVVQQDAAIGQFTNGQAGRSVFMRWTTG